MEPPQNTADSEACDWLTRQDARPLSAEEQRELDAWLKADVRNHGAYIRARVAWAHTQRLAALAPKKQITAPEPTEKQITAAEPTGVRAPRRVFAMASAAAILLALIGGVLFAQRYLASRATYRTDIGEVRSITLSDGSQLTLNTDSQATIHFSKDARDIFFSRGEAQFTVAKDSTRPFTVHAKATDVTALGTVFTVRLGPDHTNVIVSDGVVEVATTRAGAADSPVQATAIRVTANHQVTLTHGGAGSVEEPRVTRVAPATISRELAWREGKAIFAGESLAAAAAVISRHSRTQIRVDDPALAARPVTGIFRANDAESFASGAAATFGARVERINGEIHIVPTAPAGADADSSAPTR